MGKWDDWFNEFCWLYFIIFLFLLFFGSPFFPIRILLLHLNSSKKNLLQNRSNLMIKHVICHFIVIDSMIQSIRLQYTVFKWESFFFNSSLKILIKRLCSKSDKIHQCNWFKRLEQYSLIKLIHICKYWTFHFIHFDASS